MSNNLSPSYPLNSIAHLSSLGKAISVDVSTLVEVSACASLYYRQNKPNEKGRITYTVLQPLKKIQVSIKKNILDNVVFPNYLHAFIKNQTIKTNARVHLNKKNIINIDIKKFFDNCSEAHILKIWMSFFKFPKKIAKILTLLTTVDNKLAQGSSTSPGLSNLIFWKEESKLVKTLSQIGLSYSRYADDITVSANKSLDKKEKKYVIEKVNAMLAKNEFTFARKKIHIYDPSEAMIVTGQIVNSKEISISKKHIANVSAAIYQIDKKKDKVTPEEFDRLKQSIQGRVNYIKQYKCKKGAILESRLKKIDENEGLILKK